MPTKKGKSKPAKAKKTSNKMRRSPKKATSAKRKTTSSERTGTGSVTGAPGLPVPGGNEDRKATGIGANESAERIRIL